MFWSWLKMWSFDMLVQRLSSLHSAGVHFAKVKLLSSENRCGKYTAEPWFGKHCKKHNKGPTHSSQNVCSIFNSSNIQAIRITCSNVQRHRGLVLLVLPNIFFFRIQKNKKCSKIYAWTFSIRFFFCSFKFHSKHAWNDSSLKAKTHYVQTVKYRHKWVSAILKRMNFYAVVAEP